MNLFGNVFICATKILINVNIFIVWHNWMKFRWCGIFTKKIKWRLLYPFTCSKISQCSSCCGKNFPGNSILKVWLLLVWIVIWMFYMNSYIYNEFIHRWMSSDKLTSALWTIRCGYPCSHVLKVTNELQLDMIKVQHWKICAAHYNDDSSGIGMELRRIHWHTNITRAWEYLYQGNYCLDQGNLILMVSSHTYMKG